MMVSNTGAAFALLLSVALAKYPHVCVFNGGGQLGHSCPDGHPELTSYCAIGDVSKKELNCEKDHPNFPFEHHFYSWSNDPCTVSGHGPETQGKYACVYR